MIDIKEYIESGILELYVAGTLNREDSYEVYSNLQKYPELREYVQQIEQTVVKIAEVSKPKDLKAKPFGNLLRSLHQRQQKVIPIRWHHYMGWAASVVLMVGVASLYYSKSELNEKLTAQTIVKDSIKTEKQALQADLIAAKLEMNTQEEVIAFITSKETVKVDLAGQKVAPETYASVYWNQDTEEMYLDLEGLPPAPKGKVYQLWSLTLNPLTPTSLGTLDAHSQGKRFVKVGNNNASQAFGITLEPEGGSISPTLEQLYTLGLTKIS
ncbi:anti-sigma factor [Ochrovirga pacifica]|uniref:anti-sigma factor n=1 Tax=Ochrovirga pacifica TaxID=1042376 RepID=UPI0002559541|nr:anti-sigma factor [Ochrovirga pacifica]